MPMEIEDYCPSCESEQPFWLVASTKLALGRKQKYHCAECGHGFVRIDGTVDTSATA